MDAIRRASQQSSAQNNVKVKEVYDNGSTATTPIHSTTDPNHSQTAGTGGEGFIAKVAHRVEQQVQGVKEKVAQMMPGAAGETTKETGTTSGNPALGNREL
ncbi:hypothetical protein HDV05_008755 [Chytridiales sp. JEL 0842]|nr:hypothetical protein HDV05_008755 [Chytridiales sp. JEL 0842]